MTIFFIALLHAVPIFMIAAFTESRVALIIAAIIAGFIGVAIGNPEYMIADLIGVVIAYWLGMSFINAQKPYVFQSSTTAIVETAIVKVEKPRPPWRRVARKLLDGFITFGFWLWVLIMLSGAVMWVIEKIK